MDLFKDMNADSIEKEDMNESIIEKSIKKPPLIFLLPLQLL